MLVTPEIKDTVLNYFANQTSPELSVDQSALASTCGTSGDIVGIILDHFLKEGLFISKTAYKGGNGPAYIIKCSVDLYDFHRVGGFKAQDEIRRCNIMKLQSELECLAKELAPNHSKTAETISSVLSAISSVVSFIKI